MNAQRIVNKLLEGDDFDLRDDIDTLPKSAREMIYEAYRTSDDAVIYTEAASYRARSRHEEENIQGRTICNICGVLELRDGDQPPKHGDPHPIYHPECYL